MQWEAVVKEKSSVPDLPGFHPWAYYLYTCDPGQGTRCLCVPVFSYTSWRQYWFSPPRILEDHK